MNRVEDMASVHKGAELKYVHNHRATVNHRDCAKRQKTCTFSGKLKLLKENNTDVSKKSQMHTEHVKPHLHWLSSAVFMI